MTEDEIIEQLWQASQSGATIREEWLDEFVRHPNGVKRLKDLIAETDNATAFALMDLLHEFADTPRRNASKKRRKTTEGGVSWQRELAAHLHRKGEPTKRKKYLSIPQEDSGEPLILYGGKFEITRSGNVNRKGSEGPFIRCTFEDGRAPAEITFSTFERYLKKPSEKKRGG